MKKLVFMFVAFAAISFASCGGNTTPTDAAADSIADSTAVEVADSAATDSTAADSVSADTVAAPVDSAAAAQ